MLVRTIMTMAAIALLAACNTPPQAPGDRRVTAALTGAKEIPSNMSGARGTLDGTVHTGTRELRWVLNCSGMSSPVTGMHFHGPATDTQNAPVAAPMAGDCTSGPASGSVMLTQNAMNDVMQGKWYVNVHSRRYPDGEIRGQVAVISSMQESGVKAGGRFGPPFFLPAPGSLTARAEQPASARNVRGRGL